MASITSRSQFRLNRSDNQSRSGAPGHDGLIIQGMPARGQARAAAAEPGGDHADGLLYFVLCDVLHASGPLARGRADAPGPVGGQLAQKRRSYGVALHFSLPWMMTLLSLVDPQSAVLWRTSYAVIAIGGAVVLAAVRGRAPGYLGVTAYVAAIALYIVIGIVAIAPHLVKDLGMTVAPVRIEAVLLCILVFIGVNVAWLFLFDGGPAADATAGGPSMDASPDQMAAQGAAR